MPLTLNSRFAGDIYIVHCIGSIVLGPESKALEAAFGQTVEASFNQFILVLSGVDRVDSIGIGLLVRIAERLRRRGGDIRLAAPPAYLTKLLELTGLSTMLHSYPSEDDAILSFLRQPAPAAAQQPNGPRVLFIDDSADLCVFVRSILRQHGFNVHTYSLVRDASIVLQVDGADYILAGAGSLQLPADTVLRTLQPLAPKAVPLRLADDFKSRDAEQAATALLQMFSIHPSA
jgi:anti-anti-sigma factor